METIGRADRLARKLGTEHGLAAASWVFDGNTDTATYRRVAQGLADGDPEILDALPYPDLSGQWSDTPSSRDVLAELAADLGTIHPDDSDDILNAYEDAWVTAAHGEIERVALDMLAD
jgi:hypothetical protein